MCWSHERIALEGLQPIKGSSATLWRTAARKTKRYVCNLAQCLLTGLYSSILATAGGKGARRRRSDALHQGHFIITLHQPTTASLAPTASSTGHYKCQQCPPHSTVCAHIQRINPLGLDTCFCPSLSTLLLPQRAQGCTLLHNGHQSWRLTHSAVRLWWCLWWQLLQRLWLTISKETTNQTCLCTDRPKIWNNITNFDKNSAYVIFLLFVSVAIA